MADTSRSHIHTQDVTAVSKARTTTKQKFNDDEDNVKNDDDISQTANYCSKMRIDHTTSLSMHADVTASDQPRQCFP